ncbi:MAG TPA: DUF1844 domain-containing protein [Pyrinomonadaceae bacterium]
MSEEQSNFKITDRRLFNPDGTPRDIEREAEPETPAAPAEAEPPASDAAAQSAASDAPAAPPQAAQSDAGTSTSDASGFEQSSDEASSLSDESELPGAHDPASFVNFLMSIASNAASALGMMEHPVTGERGVDLQLGKHWIDILGMLQEKTRGNLLPQEQQIFEGLLADLRMQYVSLTQSPPRTPRGFTGRDIIGGK